MNANMSTSTPTRHEQENYLNAHVGAWREATGGAGENAAPPPPALAVKIAAALDATATPVRPLPAAAPRPRWSRLRAGLATAALGVAFALIALNLPGGKPAEAATALERMRVAVVAIHNAHVVQWATVYNTPSNPAVHPLPGGLQKVEEQWYTATGGGRWRKEGMWGSRIIAGGNYYRFDARTGRVVTLREMAPQWSDYSTETLLRSLAGGAGENGAQARELGVAQENGRHIRQIALETQEGSRQLFWVDAATDLPIRFEGQNKRGDDWFTTTRFDFEFNQNLPAALWNPQTLKNEGWSLRDAAQK